MNFRANFDEKNEKIRMERKENQIVPNISGAKNEFLS
jgi:hypothetical protein